MENDVEQGTTSTENPENTSEKGTSEKEEAPGVASGNASEGDFSGEIKKMKDELTEARDKYVRLYAEFENHRRRTAKERLELIQSANEQLLKALLPVADDFERAEKSFRDRNDKEAEGFALIRNKFGKTLEQHGLKMMTTAAGTDFNPDLHEAITQIPTPDESLKGKVVDVVERGYMLGDKVIRFAKVVVGQ